MRRMRWTTMIVLGALGWAPGAGAADLDAARSAIVEFIALNNDSQMQSPQGKALRTGEAAGWDLPTFSPLAGPDSVQPIGDHRVVARTQATAENGRKVDLYFYLDDNSGPWRVDAMRDLALTGMLIMARDQLEQVQDRTPEQANELRNLQLTLSSDADLRAWFAANKPAILALVARKSAGDKSVDAAIATLGLNLIEVQPSGDVDINIGGMVDNFVGLLNTRHAPPPISPDDHIWVESLGDDWYLYRTT